MSGPGIRERSETMATQPKWSFDADYLTFCNCDFGCPCNFNARPTQGRCDGAGAWRIRTGRSDGTKLDGVVFATAYFFPGLIEHGNGTTRSYLHRAASGAQRKAVEAICNGSAGGGFFELFAKLATKRYPMMVTDIDLRIDGPRVWLRVGEVMEAETELIRYPDGMAIEPAFTLPHGIEFKTGLAVNARRWWIRDQDMVASHSDKYGLVTRVRFTEKGCVG